MEEASRQEWIAYYVRTGQLDRAKSLGYEHDRMAKRLQRHARKYIDRKDDAARRGVPLSRPSARGGGSAPVSSPYAAQRSPRRSQRPEPAYEPGYSRAPGGDTGSYPPPPVDTSQRSVDPSKLTKEGFLSMIYTPGALATPHSMRSSRSTSSASMPDGRGQYPRAAARAAHSQPPPHGSNGQPRGLSPGADERGRPGSVMEDPAWPPGSPRERDRLSPTRPPPSTLRPSPPHARGAARSVDERAGSPRPVQAHAERGERLSPHYERASPPHSPYPLSPRGSPRPTPSSAAAARDTELAAARRAAEPPTGPPPNGVYDPYAQPGAYDGGAHEPRARAPRPRPASAGRLGAGRPAPRHTYTHPTPRAYGGAGGSEPQHAADEPLRPGPLPEWSHAQRPPPRAAAPSSARGRAPAGYATTRAVSPRSAPAHPAQRALSARPRDDYAPARASHGAPAAPQPPPPGARPPRAHAGRPSSALAHPGAGAYPSTRTARGSATPRTHGRVAQRSPPHSPRSPRGTLRPADELTSGGSPRAPLEHHELARQSRTVLRKSTAALLERLARQIVSADAARITAERSLNDVRAGRQTAMECAAAVDARVAELTSGRRVPAPGSDADMMIRKFQAEERVARRVASELTESEHALDEQLGVLETCIVDMRHDCANKAHLQEHLLGPEPVHAVRLPYPSQTEAFPLSPGVRSTDDLLALSSRLTDGTRALSKRAAVQKRAGLNAIKQEQWVVSQTRTARSAYSSAALRNAPVALT